MDEALDAVQSAVCKALEKQDTLRESAAVHTWFYRILVNVCIDMLRRKKREVTGAEDGIELGGSYEDPQPEDDSLAAQVEKLPLEMRTVIKLRFYEELSLKEISEVLKCPLSTVKTRLYTGLRKLRISLEGVEVI